MDVIEMARQLGKALQQDERYFSLMAASAANDRSLELQQRLARFNEIRSDLNAELTHEQLMEEAESFAVPPKMFRRIENLYGRIPVISDDTTLMAVVDAFGACIWGEEAYSVLDLNQERTSAFSALNISAQISSRISRPVSP